jgi:hypothetical protein
MKYFSLTIIFSFIFFLSDAQQPQRQIQFTFFAGHSIKLPLNSNYYLIEDSCAQITRYGHLNLKERRFFGKFKDVSRLDTNVIVGEGNYTADGLKDGEFVLHYLNGQLQAKGSFINNKYAGKWETYYEDGKPELTFEVTDGDFRIINGWKPDGTKSIDNGNGTYINSLGGTQWKGKLVNGKPDGTWNFSRTDDINSTAISTEHFKKGQFREGNVGNYSYTDASHIQLVSPDKLPFVAAEKLAMSEFPCSGGKRKHIVGVQYIGGLRNFSESIKDWLSPYFSRINLTGIDDVITIHGEVSENGSLINLKSETALREDVAHGIILRLTKLPPLHPATVDDKPVKQKLTIEFIIRDGFYQFTYSFLPIQAN